MTCRRRVMQKHEELKRLAKVRQNTRWKGYKCIGDYHAGAYECDFVSPYTKGAGNVDSEIMIMLQDWASDDALSDGFDEPSAKIGHDPTRPTNKNLKRLLKATFGMELSQTYGTNLFPFVKLGGMSEHIRQVDLVRAARDFALPQVRIVEPKLIICLGLVTFNALREACDFVPCESLASAIDSPFSLNQTRVWCQTHTGRLANRNRGGKDFVSQDWLKMKQDVYGASD